MELRVRAAWEYLSLEIVGGGDDLGAIAVADGGLGAWHVDAGADCERDGGADRK